MTALAERTTTPLGIRLLRLVGWSLIGAGVLILLYLVYSLYFTNFATGSAQADMGREWAQQVGVMPADEAPTEEPPPAPADEEPQEPAEPPAVEPGGAVAVLQFARPGSDRPPVREEPVFVVQGVTLADLVRGPGHYPGTAAPGGEGNFAVAGHRTTYGAPFFHLDQLEAGDEILVTDRAGRQHRYRVVRQEVVGPDAVRVLGPDPLGNGRPTITLTTCHPRFSARQRLVVFGELVT